jgi:tetratricopeptide (TPR) repeat protein
MAERGLASDRQAMAAHPELLDGPVQVAIDLRALGRPEEALALLDATLPRLKDPATFQDFSEKVIWLWDERSRSLRDLGRVDEAIQALKTGSLAAGTGQASVDLVLNLADLQVMAGQPEQAIETARSSEKLPASPYGHLFGDQSLACAYAQLGRKAELQVALAHLHAQEPDNWTAAVEAELCAGDLDAAAAAVIRALADARWRREVLLELSQFDPPAHKTPIERQMDERRAAVAKRPDVQAAIAKVGRTMRFNIGRPEG